LTVQIYWTFNFWMSFYTNCSDLHFFCKNETTWCIMFGITLRLEFWGVFLSFFPSRLFGLNYSSSIFPFPLLLGFSFGFYSLEMLVWDSKPLWLEDSGEQTSFVYKLYAPILGELRSVKLLVTADSVWYGVTTNQA